MAKQIVELPHRLLAHLREAKGVTYAFGIQDSSVVQDYTASGAICFWVQLDPFEHCPEARSHYSNDVYALLLTSATGRLELAPPRLLSEPVVLKALDLAEQALLSLSGWAAHDQMEILAAFEAARQGSPVERAERSIPPRNARERALLDRASALQKTFAPQLARLDEKLASYKAGLLASGMEAVVLRLSLQAELGLRLRLTSSPPSTTRSATMAVNSRFFRFVDLLQATHNGLEALQDVAEQVLYADLSGESWLQVPVIHNLHKVLLRNFPESANAGQLRNDEVRVLSQSQGCDIVRASPPTGLAASFKALVRSLDADLWRGTHPLLRAALGLHGLLQLKPYEDYNDEISGLVAQGMLMEAGLPALPINALLFWDRVHLTEYPDDPDDIESEAGFVAYFLQTVGRSIAFGRRTMLLMEPVCGRIRTALVSNGVTNDLATRIAEFAGSMVLGPDPQAVRRTIHPLELGFYLRWSGCFDEVDAAGFEFMLGGYAVEGTWSCAVARALLHQPPALINGVA
jgi:hypothetical protein